MTELSDIEDNVNTKTIKRGHRWNNKRAQVVILKYICHSEYTKPIHNEF